MFNFGLNNSCSCFSVSLQEEKIKANAEKVLLPASSPKGILQLFSQFKSKNNWKKKYLERKKNAFLIAY